MTSNVISLVVTHLHTTQIPFWVVCGVVATCVNGSCISASVAQGLWYRPVNEGHSFHYHMQVMEDSQESHCAHKHSTTQIYIYIRQTEKVFQWMYKTESFCPSLVKWLCKSCSTKGSSQTFGQRLFSTLSQFFNSTTSRYVHHIASISLICVYHSKTLLIRLITLSLV